MDNVEFLLTT